VTCYFRHLQEILKKAGIEITSQNKHEVDRVIHELVGVDYKNCPTTWKEVKKRIADDREDFVSQLKTAWKNHA
jgi:molecular chaperone GrpE (heat shock protein)